MLYSFKGFDLPNNGEIIFRAGENNSGRRRRRTPATTWIQPFNRFMGPSANKASATHNFMSNENMQLDNHKICLFNSLSSNGLKQISSDNTVESNNKGCSAQASQKFFDYGVMQSAVHAYQNQALYRKLALGPYSSVTTNKTFTPRRANEQLTIFYAGSVYVFDNVPWVTVQTFLEMARQASNRTIKVVNTKSGASVPPFKGLVSNGQILTQALNNTNHSARSCSCHSANRNGVIISPSPSHNEPPKNVNSLVKANTAETSMFRAVPEARKEALARFLKKRKERRNK